MNKMYNYTMCLNDKNYNVNMEIEYDNQIIENFETMLDNAINLLKSYGVSDEEILDEIKDDLINVEFEEFE